MNMENKKIVVSGKRKEAIARAVITEGTGKVTINKKNIEHLQILNKLYIEEPIRIAKEVLGGTNFDVVISVKGGGEKGQMNAARLALAKSIVEFSKSPDLKKVYMTYDRNLIVADVRRKEAYKPGDSKARRKRQKSYR